MYDELLDATMGNKRDTDYQLSIILKYKQTANQSLNLYLVSLANQDK